MPPVRPQRGPVLLADRLPSLPKSAPWRAWCALGTVLSAAFLVYGSLVPFRFDGPINLSRAVSTLDHSLSGPFSRSDFLANILLVVPMGFFGAATLVNHQSSVWRWLLAAAALQTAALGLSLGVEGLQAFMPERTSSLLDVMAQQVGTFVGLAGWRVICGDVSRWAEKWTAGERGGIVRNALALYALARIMVILWPLDITLDIGGLAHKFRHGGVVLNPLHSPVVSLDMLPSMLMAALMAAPVGVWVSVVGVAGRIRRPATTGLMLSTGLFFAVEAVQLFILSCRADSAEFVVNAVGAAAGVALASTVWPMAAARHSSVSDRQSNLLPALGLCGALLLYAAYNLSPFDFHLSPEFIRSRVGNLVGVPFYGYYINPEFKALDDAVIKITIALPIGVCLALLMGSRNLPYRRIAMGAALFLIAVFLTAVEAGQVLLPTRYPDDSDIILAFVGVVAGLAMERLVRPSSPRRA